MSGINYFQRMVEIAEELEKHPEIEAGKIPKIKFFNTFMIDQGLTTKTAKRWFEQAVHTGLINIINGEHGTDFIKVNKNILSN